MKKNVFVYLFSFLILPVLFSCNNEKKEDKQPKQEEKQQEISAEFTGESDNFKSAFADTKLLQFDEFLWNQLECAACTSDCDTCNLPAIDCSSSEVHCISEDCAKKILCCHAVSKDTFMWLTDTFRLGKATFDPADVQKVLNYADCKRDTIRLSIVGTSYRVRCVKAGEILAYGSHWSNHSETLIQEVLDLADLKDLILYRSISLPSGRKIVPFLAVTMNAQGMSDSSYFNVSGLP